MRRFLYTLAAVVLLSVCPALLSQPYSFVKSHETGARYVKLQSSTDTLFAISQSNYIDLYNLNEFEQKKPRKRLEFDRVVTDAVYSAGHLLVGSDLHLDVYQLDNDDNAVLKKRLPFEINKAQQALYAEGDYVAINRDVKVELLKWSNGVLTAVTAINQPAPSYYAKGVAIDTDQMVINWFNDVNSGSIVHTYSLATGSIISADFTEPHSPLLLSTTERITFSSTNTLNWYEFQNNEWRLKATRNYATRINQWFQSEKRLFGINPTYYSQDSILEFRLENGAITEDWFSLGVNQYCNYVIALTQSHYCLMDDRITLLDLSNSTPQITKNLALFTPESEALASNDTQLFQLSAHQLRSTSLQQPDLFNSTASLAIQRNIYHLNTFRDQVLLNNGQTYINLKNQDSEFSITEQITDSDLKSGSTPKNWFAPNTLIGIADKLQRLHFYKTDTERFLLSPSAILNWDEIQLPEARKIAGVREVHYRNNWLVLRLNTTSNIDAIYAVPLNPTTYKPVAQAQLLTDELGHPLWSDEIHSDGTSLILYTTQDAYRLVVLEIDNTQIRHKNSYDLTPYPSCRGSFTKLSNNFLLINTSSSHIKESGYCLFEHKAGELTYIQELSAPGHFRFQMGFTFAQFGSTLAAATNEDGRTTFYQKNYAPQSELILSEIVEDSKDQLVVQSTDVEHDSIVLQLMEQPKHGEISITDHQLFYTPDADFFGVDQWLLRSSDSHGNFTETRHQLTVTAVNDAPQLQAPDSFNLPEDTSLTVQLVATDAEQQQISFQLLENPRLGAATITPAGLLSYTPTENLFGQDQLEVQLTDTEGASRVETITLQIEAVNDLPQLQQLSLNGNEDETLVAELQIIDPDSTIGSIELIEPPLHGSATFSGTTLTYQPKLDFNGTELLKLRLNDSVGGSTDTILTLHIEAVNDIPVLGGMSHFSAQEDTPFTVQLNATDIEQHSVTFQLMQNGQLGTASVTPAGLLSYTSAANLFGQDQLQVQLIDSEGGSKIETITLQIEAVNDLPQLQQLSLNGTEDETLVAELQIIDPDSTIGSIELIEPPLNGSATFSGTTLTYQPKLDFNGTELLKIRLNDSAGGNTETSLTLQIEAVNDAPFYTGAIMYEVAEDSSLLIALTAQDKENQLVQFSLQSSATLGVAQLSAAGELRYIPHPDRHGEETLTIQLTDTEQASITMQLTIRIVAVNDLPALKQSGFSIGEDAELSVTLEVVDVDSAPGSIELTQNASHGVAILTGATLSYKPTANYSGQDKIKLRLNDSAGGFSEVEVQLQVTSVNDAPVLTAQNFSLTTGTSRSLQLTATDVENDLLSYNLLNSATLGTATLSTTGLLSYTATTAGTENLTIEVKDAGGAIAQATVTVTITTPPPAPAESSGSLGWPALALLLLCYSRRRYKKR